MKYSDYELEKMVRREFERNRNIVPPKEAINEIIFRIKSTNEFNDISDQTEIEQNVSDIIEVALDKYFGY
jgi:hypothetical protein